MYVFPCRLLTAARTHRDDIVYLCKKKGKPQKYRHVPGGRVVLWMLFVATRAASFVNREKLRARYAFIREFM